MDPPIETAPKRRKVSEELLEEPASLELAQAEFGPATLQPESETPLTGISANRFYSPMRLEDAARIAKLVQYGDNAIKFAPVPNSSNITPSHADV